MEPTTQLKIDGRMYESRMKRNVRIHRHTDRQSRLDRYVSSGRILHAFFWFEMVRTRISPCPSPEASHCSPHSGDLIPRVASQLCDSFLVRDGAGTAYHLPCPSPRFSQLFSQLWRTDSSVASQFWGFFVRDGADRRYDIVRSPRLSHCSPNPRRTDTLGCLSVLGHLSLEMARACTLSVPRGFHVVLSALEN